MSSYFLFWTYFEIFMNEESGTDFDVYPGVQLRDSKVLGDSKFT